jgi:hypothetical protein
MPRSQKQYRTQDLRCLRQHPSSPNGDEKQGQMPFNHCLSHLTQSEARQAVANIFLDLKKLNRRLNFRVKNLQGNQGSIVHRMLNIIRPAWCFVLLAPELANADSNFNNCVQGYKTLCDETALSAEQLGQLKQKRSADMLKICKISIVLCNKDVLLPADLEKTN